MGQKSSKSFIIYKLNLIHIYTLINFRVLGKIFQNYFFPKSLNYTLFNNSISIHILTNTYFTVVKKKFQIFYPAQQLKDKTTMKIWYQSWYHTFFVVPLDPLDQSAKIFCSLGKVSVHVNSRLKSLENF
jgi:hypothetical protein